MDMDALWSFVLLPAATSGQAPSLDTSAAGVRSWLTLHMVLPVSLGTVKVLLGSVHCSIANQ